MTRIFDSSESSLLANKASLGKIYLGITLAALCSVVGCGLTPTVSSVVAPKSSVIAQSVKASALETNWLTSVTLSYARSQATARTDTNSTNVADETPKSETLQVLGVRFPHPDGHKDRARVELVIAEPMSAKATTSWRTRLGQSLSKTLPGISLGAGIRQAKAIDLPLGELQQLLVKVQPVVTQATSTSPKTTQIQFTSEVNGQHSVVQTAPVEAMEQLIIRVAREGRLIGYSGSADQLQQQLGQAAGVQLVDRSTLSNEQKPMTRSALVPLPPVILQ